ncbi:MAG: cupin domain-containing protein [Acidimicrobiia bacterium]|nr:cupin domain-containing protein [Acidimicrobiia bacterium]
MSIEHTLANEAVVLAPGGGTRLEFLNHLATVKVAADGARSMSVVEFFAPRGFGPPQHRHNEEDELFIVLDGELRFFLGDDTFGGEAGSMAYLPRAIRHTFQVLSPTARLVNVTSSNTVVPRFDEMVAALGEPTDRTDMPEPAPIDPGRVAEVCAAHGIDIVGPPPPAL